MKTVTIRIEGVSALLINRFKEESELPTKITKGKKDYGSPRFQAEATAYCDAKTKNLWIPSSWITGAIKTVASDYKLSGTRKSLKSVSGGAVVPIEEKIYFKEKYKLKDVEVDSRPVVVQRARIMRHRARLENWTLEFSLEVDESIVPTDQLHEVMNDAGRRSGLGDYRPPKGGPFGRFIVSKWTVQGAKPVKKTRARKTKK